MYVPSAFKIDRAACLAGCDHDLSRCLPSMSWLWAVPPLQGRHRGAMLARQHGRTPGRARCPLPAPPFWCIQLFRRFGKAAAHCKASLGGLCLGVAASRTAAGPRATHHFDDAYRLDTRRRKDRSGRRECLSRLWRQAGGCKHPRCATAIGHTDPDGAKSNVQQQNSRSVRKECLRPALTRSTLVVEPVRSGGSA